jgi:hypothetical protein
MRPDCTTGMEGEERADQVHQDMTNRLTNLSHQLEDKFASLSHQLEDRFHVLELKMEKVTSLEQRLDSVSATHSSSA